MKIRSEFLLRTATLPDALCIGVLATQVFLDTYATEGIRPDLAREVLAGCGTAAFESRLLDPHTSFILAERHGHLVGFAETVQGRPCPIATPATRPYGTELVRLYVQRAFHRQGIGQALLDDAERLTSSPGLWLTAWSGNAQALAFYRARSYASIGTVDHLIEGQAYENQVLVRIP